MPTFEHYKQVIPAGFYSLAFEHEIDAAPDRQICTLGIGIAGFTLDLTKLGLVADAWKDNIIDTMASTNTLFARVTASDAGGVVFEVDRTDVGSEVGPFSPISVAAIVEKRTGVSGRRHRGRIFLPMVPDSQVSERGVLAGSFRTGVASNFTNLQTAIELLGGAPQVVLLHSKGWDGGVEPADPGNAPAPDPITSWACKQVIGTQRRRLR